MTRKGILAALTLAAALASGVSADEKVAGLRIIPENATVKPKRRLRFVALLYAEDGTARTPHGVKWGASGGAIDEEGNYVPLSESGVFTVTASFSRYRAEAKVRVSETGPKIKRIEVVPNWVTLKPGRKRQFRALAYDPWDRPVPFRPTWRVRGGGTIDRTGQFTAKAKGVWTVRAEDPRTGLEGSATVYVDDKFPPAEKLRIEPAHVELLPGEAVHFIAQALDGKGRRAPLRPSWTATGGSVDETGRYVAGQATGTCQVTVRDRGSGRQTRAAVVIRAFEKPSRRGMEVTKWEVSRGHKGKGPHVKANISVRVRDRRITRLRLYLVNKDGGRKELRWMGPHRNRKTNFRHFFSAPDGKWLEVCAYDGKGELVDSERRELPGD